MIIAGRYSFKRGIEETEERCPELLREIEAVIAEVDSSQHFTKVSEEKTMSGKLLYSPGSLNKAFKQSFAKRGWESVKITGTYSTDYYVAGCEPPVGAGGSPPFREMDFVKENLGVEVQFGKYSFMVYNVCAKMTIFNKLGYIDLGVEIVPVKDFADHMSTGVSFFEQMVWDLEQRGYADIDIPVIILGVNAEGPHPEQPTGQPDSSDL